MHEASLHSQNCFVTLTYADEHMPEHGSLVYRDFQLFMKRVRKKMGKVRFFMCGEYGEKFLRPHFHACLFGARFDDGVFFSRSGSGSDIYISLLLSSLWSKGHASFGELTFESAAYVARYTLKKSTNVDCDGRSVCVDKETGEVYDLVPEMCRMSLRPGIGAGWIKKWYDDVYPADYVIVDGSKMKPPKYYDRYMRQLDPVGGDFLEFDREQAAQASAGDNTCERLEVREKVANARLAFKKRSLQ